VTELETLHRRRELVLLSAELQRATLARRIARVEASPVRRVALGVAKGAVTLPLALKVGSMVARLVTRVYRRRSKRGRLFAT
jgi:hypothetical protein